MHLRFLVPKNGNSPNGYLGDGEVNVTTGQTKQVVEETARAGVKNWLDSKMGVIDMQVWKVRDSRMLFSWYLIVS